MDGLKKQQITKKENPKLVREYSTLVLNYYHAKPEQRALKRDALEKYILKRKQTNNPIDVNANMGFEIKVQNGKLTTLIEIVSIFDDWQLFEFLRAQGLQEGYDAKVPLWYLFIYRGHNACLEKLLLNCDFDKCFVNHSWMPLHVAISFKNPVAFDLFLKHPKFDKKYLEYVDNANKVNALMHATLHYDPVAIQKLLDAKAPFMVPDSILTPVDYALHKYFEVYVEGCFSTYMRQKIGLGPVYKGNEVRQSHVAQSIKNIIDTFSLVFSRLPHECNTYQLVPVQLDNNPLKKRDLFKCIEEYHLALKFSPKMLKLLLDILLSMGPGLYFRELPVVLQKLYASVPSNVQVVMPVILPNGQIHYLYSKQEVEKYFQANIKSIQSIGALSQYAKMRLGVSIPGNKITDACLQNIQKLIHETFDYVEEKIVTTMFEEGKEESLNVLLKTQIKNLMTPGSKSGFNETVEHQSNALTEIRRHICHDKYFTTIQDDITRVEYSAKKNAGLVPGMLSALIKLSHFYRGTQQVTLLPLQEKILIESTDLFTPLASNLDFFMLNFLYCELLINKRHNDIIIDEIKDLLIAFHLLNKKNHYTNHQEYKAAYFRAHYILEAALLMLYAKTGKQALALQQFNKIARMLGSVQDNSLFCTTSYSSLIHHSVFTAFMLEQVDFASKHVSPQEWSTILCHVLQYKGKCSLPQGILNNAFQCIEQCIKNELFDETEELLALTEKHSESIGNTCDYIRLKILYSDVVVDYFKKISQLILTSELEGIVKLDLAQRLLQVDLNQVTLSSSYMNKLLPDAFSLERKMIVVDLVHLYTFREIEVLFETIKKIIQIAKKQAERKEANLADRLSALTLSAPKEPEKEERQDSAAFLTMFYFQQKHARKKQVRKVKPQPGGGGSPGLGTPDPKLTISKAKFDRVKLRLLANIGEEYSDLIMITDGEPVRDNLRFLVIKNDPQFETFYKACHHLVNEEGEASVFSANPYGENQHGVKLYDKDDDACSSKTIANKYEKEPYVTKVKGSGSDRAAGIGRVFEFEGKKIIIYFVDEILNHKKALKLIK